MKCIIRADSDGRIENTLESRVESSPPLPSDFHQQKGFEKVLENGVSGICFWTNYGEHIVFLNALSVTSNSLTGRQRKNLLSHGWRIKFGYVMLPMHSYKVFRSSQMRSTESYPFSLFFLLSHNPTRNPFSRTQPLMSLYSKNQQIYI